MSTYSEAYQTLVEQVCKETVGPAASEVDASAVFPARSIEALRKVGLMGAVSAPEAGGMGLGFAGAADIVQRVAQDCGSTAMVLCMHYCGAAVLEAYGAMEVRRAVASGGHLSTLAFSEEDWRSHFWAPVSAARGDGAEVVLEAHKSCVGRHRVCMVVQAAARRGPEHHLAGACRHARGGGEWTLQWPGLARQRLRARHGAQRAHPGRRGRGGR